jgi:hypothetical protein
MRRALSRRSESQVLSRDVEARGGLEQSLGWCFHSQRPRAQSFGDPQTVDDIHTSLFHSDCFTRAHGTTRCRSVARASGVSYAHRTSDLPYPLNGSISSRKVPSGSLKQKNFAPAPPANRMVTGSETISTPSALRRAYSASIFLVKRAMRAIPAW